LIEPLRVRSSPGAAGVPALFASMTTRALSLKPWSQDDPTFVGRRLSTEATMALGQDFTGGLVTTPAARSGEGAF
jgi:hypothetical protein